jgi:hypothetical protein
MSEQCRHVSVLLRRNADAAAEFVEDGAEFRRRWCRISSKMVPNFVEDAIAHIGTVPNLSKMMPNSSKMMPTCRVI